MELEVFAWARSFSKIKIRPRFSLRRRLFAAISLRTRSREIMLPLLLFPISIPALLATVEGTTAILTGDYSPKFWIVLLAAYNVVFTTACLLLFDNVLNAE